MASAPFWVAMICQIIIVLGYFWFYRKEQLGTCLRFLVCLHSANDLVLSTPMITTPMCRLALLDLYRTIQYLFEALFIQGRTVTIGLLYT